MISFIDDNKQFYGVELICRVLPIAPSTYHRAKDLEDCPEKRSLRSQHDDFYISEIKRIWRDSKCRYGVRKVWQQMKSDSTAYKGFGAVRVRLLPIAVMTNYGLMT